MVWLLYPMKQIKCLKYLLMKLVDVEAESNFCLLSTVLQLS